MHESICPICAKSMPACNPRYPRAVCPDCMNRAVDAAGRRVQFFNTVLSGGLTGCYVEDGSPYDSAACVIDGCACRASEAYMGGVVIEVVAD